MEAIDIKEEYVKDKPNIIYINCTIKHDDICYSFKYLVSKIHTENFIFGIDIPKTNKKLLRSLYSFARTECNKFIIDNNISVKTKSVREEIEKRLKSNISI